MTVDEIRALALAATPGPWEWQEYRSAAFVNGVGMPGCRMFLDATGRSYGHVLKITWPELLKDADADYIAAVNPLVVLALLDERDALARSCEELNERNLSDACDERAVAAEVALGVARQDVIGHKTNAEVWRDSCREAEAELAAVREVLRAAQYLLKREEYMQYGADLEGPEFAKHVCVCCGWPKGGHNGPGRIKGNAENTHEQGCSLDEVLHGRPAPRLADLIDRVDAVGGKS